MNAAAASLLNLPAMLAANPRIGVLIALLIAAAVIDYRSLRIPNWLTVGGMLLGLAWSAVLPSSDHTGIVWALGGTAVGFGVMLPLYVLRILGAGDVKLMAMAGAFLGVSGALGAILFTFIAGGIAALAFAAWHRAIGRMAGNVRNIVGSMAFAAFAGIRPTAANAGAVSIGKLPYGISICVGTIASLAITQLGFA